MKHREADKKNIVYIIENFPCPSETFIAREVELMADENNLRVFAINGIPEKISGTKFPINYFSEQKFRILLETHLRIFIKNPLKYLSLVFFSINSENPLKSFSAFVKSGYFIRLVNGMKVEHVHSHFANLPTDIAMQISHYTGIPFSFTAHAKDIYVCGYDIRKKVKKSSFTITCNDSNRILINKKTKNSFVKKIHCAYHGIDIGMWNFKPDRIQENSGAVKIITVGRLDEKKGYQYIISALSNLIKKGYDIHWNIVGDGTYRNNLEVQIKNHILENNVTFHGWIDHNRITDFLGNNEIFIQPSVKLNNGDMDGIPNVIMEAMASGIPIISTDISAITEVLNNKNAILIPPDNPSAIEAAVIHILSDPDSNKKRIKQAREDALKLDSGIHFTILKNIFSDYIG